LAVGAFLATDFFAMGVFFTTAFVADTGPEPAFFATAVLTAAFLANDFLEVVFFATAFLRTIFSSSAIVNHSPLGLRLKPIFGRTLISGQAWRPISASVDVAAVGGRFVAKGARLGWRPLPMSVSLVIRSG
jgi:hypothetical protein